ncbi:MAG: dual specificity protein phosphatase family protein [Planctomycetes bacterium]|nr:dual specificity protein phosphatase family protein [Planctomycetota bacterium]MCW8134872.1 dual specificity protein phosphatase family protein [Planctomycetota bacterium]
MNGFSWVIEGEIAGMARPARDARGLWAWLAERGVGLVVSLTSSPPDPGVLAQQGIELLHLPVADFAPPLPEVIDKFLEQARFQRHEGRAVVVHCGAGIGRTGTMLACYLVDKGMSAEEAIAAVRKARPGSIETREQEEAVRDLERRLRAR